MAGSDFTAFLSLIGKVVVWVISRTLDLVCLILLATSCVLPWRLIENCYQNIFDDADSWRCMAVVAFMLTLLDVVVVPLTLLSLMSPFRWLRVYSAFRRYDKNGDWDLRCELSFGCLLVPLDLLSAACFLLQHLFPLRTHLLYRRLADHWRAATANRSTYYGSERSEVALFVIWTTCMALLDALCCVVGGVCTLVTPSLWYCTVHGVRRNFSPPPSAAPAPTTPVVPQQLWSEDRWDTAYKELRELMLWRVLLLPVDWGAILLGIFALLSPFRHLPFRRALLKDGAPWLCGLGLPGGPQGHQSVAEKTFNQPDRDVGGVYSDISYNVTLRKHCFYYGSTAVVDVLLFPVMLPLLLTWYRYRPVRAELFDTDQGSEQQDEQDGVAGMESQDPGGDTVLADKGKKRRDENRTVPIKQWGFREYGIIARQFSFLVLDCLFAPFLLLVFTTQYRYAPVRTALAADDRSSWYSLRVYTALFQTCGLMLLDVVVLPAWLLLLVTYYRRGPALFIWRTKTLWHGTDDIAIWFHVTVVCNFFLVLHDILLVPLLVLALTLGIRDVRTTLHARWQEPQLEERPQERPQEDEVAEMRNPSIVQQDEAPDLGLFVSVSRSAAPVPARVPDVFPLSTWRKKLWYDFFNIFFDLPFVAMKIVVYGTLWRAKRLYASLEKVNKDIPEEYDYFTVDFCDQDEDDCCCCCSCLCFCCCWFDFYRSYNRRNWALREQILEQFLLLLRDVLMLAPMAVVIGTLYRLPNLILDVVSKCSPMNTSDEPAFSAYDVRMKCPEVAGDPLQVSIRCQLSTSAASRSGGTDVENNESSNPVAHTLDCHQCYAAPVKLFVSGDGFWTSVGQAFGDGLMRIGRGMLPKKLVAGQGVGVGVVQALDDTEGFRSAPEIGLLQTDTELQPLGNSGRYKIDIILDVGNAKRTAILKALQSLNQDVRVILQVEAVPTSVAASLSPVVVAVTPKVATLVRIFDQQTNCFTPDDCDREGCTRTGLLASEEPSAGVVDELWIVVLLHFVEVLQDIAHLCLSLCTLLMPWRAVELLVAVSETDQRATWREARHLHREYCDAKDCLEDYKAGMAPLMNSLSKQTKRTRSAVRPFDRYRHRWYNHYHTPAVTNRLKDLEQQTWKEYKDVVASLLKRAGNSPSASIQAFGAALRESRAMEELRLSQWAHRYVFNTLSAEEERQWRMIAKKPRERGEWEEEGEGENTSVSELLVQVVEATEAKARQQQEEKDRNVESALGAIYESVLEEGSAGSQGRPLSWRKRWGGLGRRSTGALRKLVQQHFLLTVRDLGYLLTLLVVCLTAIRTLPLIRDLWRLGPCLALKLTDPAPRRVLLLHLRGTGRDLKRLGKCLGYSSCVLLLGVGVPSFLTKLPSRMRSLEDATLCAQEHLHDSCRYLGELLCLFTAWRSYKLVLTAALYAILVPPACLAEAIPRALSSVQVRFISGVLVWFGLAIGAFLLTLHESAGEASEESVRTAFFALFGSLTAVVACATLSLQMRSALRNPIADSSTGFVSLSWSHIFAMLLGPIEAVQLSSVVLYFFWNDNDAGGNFTFPVVFLFDTPDSHPDHFFSYDVAMSLTSSCVYVWVVVVSLPLVFDADRPEERLKMRALQLSPVFEALHVLLSRLLFVSIVATLLRPFSCQQGEHDAIGSDGMGLVLSTDRDVMCGGDKSFFSGSASSILLIFFVITSTVLHADSPDMLNTPTESIANGEASSAVHFAPLFALVLRLGQFLLCVLLMGLGPGAGPSGGKRGVLLCVAIVAVVLAGWCLLYPWRSCSLPCVAPIRAAGFTVVAFAACLCYLRDGDELTNFDPHWRDQTMLFPVAGLLFAAGGVGGWWVQRKATKTWKIVLQAAGLGDALEGVAQLGEALLVADALGGSRDGAKRRAEVLLKQAEECRSAPQLGLMLVRFEEQILAERLRFEFLCSRDEWRGLLLGVEGRVTDDSVGDSGRVSYDHIVQGAQALRSAIRPRSPLAVVNKHLVAMVFINHLPEYVAWEVFRFMYDVTPLVRALEPLLLQNHDDSSSNYRYSWSPRHALGLLLAAEDAERSLREQLYSKSLKKI